ncbi:unnamed protein product, partial [Staurois parvus]
RCLTTSCPVHVYKRLDGSVAGVGGHLETSSLPVRTPWERTAPIAVRDLCVRSRSRDH